ncbi:MAG: uroporphyrinogen decarboxylase family protein [Eubacteriales bacterium]
MNSTERVRNAITGKPFDRQPIYGWVSANLSNEIAAAYGSVDAFEDHYEFDMAHLFGGPCAFRWDVIARLREENEELTPDLLLDEDIFTSPEGSADYEGIRQGLAHHKERGRFCYIQTPGFFEQFNDVFGIENQLLYLAMYPDELCELYRRQAEWTVRFADHCIDLGVDMIHISDDWGAQKDLLFSPRLWREIIYPHMKRVVDHVHSRGVLCSLHSDGCIAKVADGIAELGLDCVHPWQESAGMSYDLYLERYSDQFAILGGVCVQSAIGILPRDQLEAEIRRVFGKLRGKRWICCTTHFVQNHCSIEDLTFAYDLIYRLARE